MAETNIKTNISTIIALLAFNLLIACKAPPTKVVTPSVVKSFYGKLSDGRIVNQYELIAKDINVSVLTYGGIITSIEVPDKSGDFANVVLGYDNLADYEHKNRFFGTIVGRYANRIAKGELTLNNQKHQLTVNRAPHHLHGGQQGFDKKLWQATPFMTEDTAGVHLDYTSPHDEEGYPGNLAVRVTYFISTESELTVQYKATTDQVTVFNPTQHSYFNLAGTSNENVLAHELTINAEHYLPLKADGVPTGTIAPVKGTAFDFLTPKHIGKDINAKNEQLIKAKGYDHYFLQSKRRGELTRMATLSHHKSGRKMDVWSTEVGAQLYSANYLSPTVIGAGNVPMQEHQGICIETGQYPNAPAENKFPLIRISSEQEYFSQTIVKFYTVK